MKSSLQEKQADEGRGRPHLDDGNERAGGMSRRRFLEGVGRGAVAVLLGGAALPPVVRFIAEASGQPLKPPGLQHRYSMVFDLRLCDGCGKCTEACQQMHHLPKELEYIKVHEFTADTGQVFNMPVLCMMCQNAPCYRVCPVGATFYDEDGLVLIDQDKCIGCRACIAACPYGARYFNYEEGFVGDPALKDQMDRRPDYPGLQAKGTVGKCAFCSHLLKKGELPACVERCSMEAIYIGDWEKDLATNGRSTVQLSKLLKDNDAFRFKAELNTHPSVYYIAGHGQDIDYY